MPVTAPGTGDGLRIVTEAELDAAARLIQAAASSYIDEALEATVPAVTTHCTLDVAGLVVQPDSSLVFAVRPSPFFYPHRLAEGDDTAEGAQWEDDGGPQLQACERTKLLSTNACGVLTLALIGYLMSLDGDTLFAVVLLFAAALAAFFSAASQSCGTSLRDIELPPFFCRPEPRRLAAR